MGLKFVIAGGSGFIGSGVARRCRMEGAEVVILTRGQPALRKDGAREIQWLGGAVWQHELAGATAVINLAGSTINCVHTRENLGEVLESRLNAVRALGEAARSLAVPPKAWVQGNAIGYYGNPGENRCDESAASGSDAMADVCREWQHAFEQACPAAVRPVLLRIGVVLDGSGGAFPKLAGLTRAFLGGTVGHGRQGMSWILLEDLAEIIVRAATDPTMRGVYNATAPEPVSNAEFMRAMRHALHRPWSPPAPAFAVKIGARLMGTDPSLALEGQYVVPARLQAEGFQFRGKTINEAFAALM